MFYANPSIKKAAIAYSGAWAAFGIEFNFPVSHNWMTMSPVNFAFGKHDDGSASVTIGNIDRVYGMEWMVELVLRPKSTLLEQRVTLSNRSDVRHRFYWWNNAGIEAWDDSQIVYPMRFAATHGFTEIHPWPVDQDGVDYSILPITRKGPFPCSSTEAASLYGNLESAYEHWHHILPSTKSFRKEDHQGVLQTARLAQSPLRQQQFLFRGAGRFASNQETYAFLQPRQITSRNIDAG